MILIVGGFSQGKTEYLKSLPEYRTLASGGRIPRRADGKTDSPELALSCPVILNFHHYIKQMPDEIRIREFIDRIIEENPEALITMEEVGCGIVPGNRPDRAYREFVGYAGQRLAREASQVHRVICGIGVRIK